MNNIVNRKIIASILDEIESYLYLYKINQEIIVLDRFDVKEDLTRREFSLIFLTSNELDSHISLDEFNTQFEKLFNPFTD